MDELTPEQIQELTGLLEGLRSELAEALQGSRNSGKPVDLGLPIGRISRVDAIQQQQMAQAGAAAQEQRIHQIVAALAAAAAGTYGCCRRCDEPIGYRRLRARPETLFCLRCQTLAEKR
ncbi:MAG: TraR/DksA C4-type zinc finger protein [Syntrophobacterales bacterium]|nr:TraR/DksA C4-type zinc finger protein [Syntrophobacterales bacterium]